MPPTQFLLQLGLCVTFFTVAHVNAHERKCTARTIRDGICMPSRRSLLSLNTFKRKVRVMY